MSCVAKAQLMKYLLNLLKKIQRNRSAFARVAFNNRRIALYFCIYGEYGETNERLEIRYMLQQ